MKESYLEIRKRTKFMKAESERLWELINRHTNGSKWQFNMVTNGVFPEPECEYPYILIDFSVKPQPGRKEGFDNYCIELTEDEIKSNHRLIKILTEGRNLKASPIGCSGEDKDFEPGFLVYKITIDDYSKIKGVSFSWWEKLIAFFK
ncbi:MAG: hypothetical protein V1804_04340 [Patescibacteria group bacterium]